MCVCAFCRTCCLECSAAVHHRWQAACRKRATRSTNSSVAERSSTITQRTSSVQALWPNALPPSLRELLVCKPCGRALFHHHSESFYWTHSVTKRSSITQRTTCTIWHTLWQSALPPSLKELPLSTLYDRALLYHHGENIVEVTMCI